MNTKSEMTLIIEAISENESFARAVVAAYACRLNPTLEQLDDIKTAVSEAVTNAIVHGYNSDPSRKVEITCAIEGQDFFVAVRDEGCGIEDVIQARTPFYTTCPEGERSGMGFTMMESFMDDVQVTSQAGQGTCVKMRKYLPQGV